jgi:hypothetical protein
MMLYKYIPAEYGMRSIKSNNFKLTTVMEANDPYEFKSIKNLEGGITDLICHPSFSDNYLIACFSRNFKSPVMWSHYAENHTGFVLGYECLNNKKLIKVKYVDKLSKYKNINFNNIITHLATVKYSEWSYEEEIRMLFSKKIDSVFTENSKHFFLDLTNNNEFYLKKVIFGINCKENMYYEEITKISPYLKIFKAEQSHNNFKIRAKKV